MQKQYRGSSLVKIGEEMVNVDYYLLTDYEKTMETYGIEITENNLECEIVRDITPDKSIAEKLIEQFMKNDLLPIHLHDVIEDWL